MITISPKWRVVNRFSCFLPTILDAAGITVPADVHGRSLRPVLSKYRARWREYLAAEFHCHGAKFFFLRRAIRDKRYELIRNLCANRAEPMTGIDGDIAYKVSRWTAYANTPARIMLDTYAAPPEYELYDLYSDPIEATNLAGKSEVKSVQKRLTNALEQWRVDTRDPFLEGSRKRSRIWRPPSAAEYRGDRDRALDTPVRSFE